MNATRICLLGWNFLHLCTNHRPGFQSNAFSPVLSRFEGITSCGVPWPNMIWFTHEIPLGFPGLVHFLSFTWLLSLPLHSLQQLPACSELPQVWSTRKDLYEAGTPVLLWDRRHISAFSHPPDTPSIPDYGGECEVNDDFCQMNLVMCLFWNSFWVFMMKLRDGRAMHSSFIRISNWPSLVLKPNLNW